jgi:hypothetical protein
MVGDIGLRADAEREGVDTMGLVPEALVLKVSKAGRAAEFWTQAFGLRTTSR